MWRLRVTGIFVKDFLSCKGSTKYWLSIRHVFIYRLHHHYGLYTDVTSQNTRFRTFAEKKIQLIFIINVKISLSKKKNDIERGK